jgi:glycosyltransferase involved in cell wall biosynthesis
MTGLRNTVAGGWEVHHVAVEQPRVVVDVAPGRGGAYVVLWQCEIPRTAVHLPRAELPLTVAELIRRVGPIPAPPAEVPADRSGACTVVVCTRGRSGSLARCLDSLADLDPGPAAVLVVDNEPRDPAVRDLIAARPYVTYIAEPRPGLDIARNTGWRNARTPLVAYTDDDVVVHRSWLRALTGGFDSAEVVAVTGLVLPMSLETEAQQIFERHWSFNKGFAARDFGPDFYASTRAHGAPTWEIGAGASMAFRRDFLAASGGFDERLDAGAAGCSGDSEMWYRVLAEGLTCRYLPSAVCFHEHRRETSALRGQLRAYLRGHVAALLVQYERYGEPGNLRRALLTLPTYYAGLAGRRLLGRGDPTRTATIGPEVMGALGGLAFCLRDPAWRAAVRRRINRTAM